MSRKPQPDEEEYYVIPIFDQPVHTPDHLFCDDPACPCKDDPGNQEQLAEWYNEGLIGATDGKLIYDGHTIR